MVGCPEGGSDESHGGCHWRPGCADREPPGRNASDCALLGGARFTAWLSARGVEIVTGDLTDSHWLHQACTKAAVGVASAIVLGRRLASHKRPTTGVADEAGTVSLIGPAEAAGCAVSSTSRTRLLMRHSGRRSSGSRWRLREGSRLRRGGVRGSGVHETGLAGGCLVHVESRQFACSAARVSCVHGMLLATES